jgi:hypothetical protein
MTELHTERLVGALLRLEPAARIDDLRVKAVQLIQAVRASPRNPNGDNVEVIVNDLIAVIDVLIADDWYDIQRALIRSRVNKA